MCSVMFFLYLLCTNDVNYLEETVKSCVLLPLTNFHPSFSSFSYPLSLFFQILARRVGPQPKCMGKGKSRRLGVVAASAFNQRDSCKREMGGGDSVSFVSLSNQSLYSVTIAEAEHDAVTTPSPRDTFFSCLLSHLIERLEATLLTMPNRCQWYSIVVSR